MLCLCHGQRTCSGRKRCAFDSFCFSSCGTMSSPSVNSPVPPCGVLFVCERGVLVCVVCVDVVCRSPISLIFLGGDGQVRHFVSNGSNTIIPLASCSLLTFDVSISSWLIDDSPIPFCSFLGWYPAYLEHILYIHITSVASCTLFWASAVSPASRYITLLLRLKCRRPVSFGRTLRPEYWK